MAETTGARVIQLFPQHEPTCFRCQFFTEVVDSVGVSSHCGLYDEAIESERMAEECEGYIEQ